MPKNGKEKEKENEDETKCHPASYLEMMRYATCFDWLLVIIGLFFSFTSGALTPTSCIIFRGITNTLMKGQADYNSGELDIEWFTTEMLFYIKLYFHLAAITFVLEYIAVRFFI